MAKIDLYNQKGEKQGTITVSDVIFTAKFNKGLVPQDLEYMLTQRLKQKSGVEEESLLGKKEQVKQGKDQ